MTVFAAIDLQTLNKKKMKIISKIFLLLILFNIVSCGPSLCDCVHYQTNDTEACEEIYELNLGTKYPSEMRLESVRKGSCKEKGEEIQERLKEEGY